MENFSFNQFRFNRALPWWVYLLQKSRCRCRATSVQISVQTKKWGNRAVFFRFLPVWLKALLDLKYFFNFFDRVFRFCWPESLSRSFKTVGVLRRFCRFFFLSDPTILVQVLKLPSSKTVKCSDFFRSFKARASCFVHCFRAVKSEPCRLEGMFLVLLTLALWPCDAVEQKEKVGMVVWTWELTLMNSQTRPNHVFWVYPESISTVSLSMFVDVYQMFEV